MRSFLLLLALIFAVFGVWEHSSRTQNDPVQAKALNPYVAKVPRNCMFRENGALPDPRCTPGAYNQKVTQRTIGGTICKKGWASTIRPPESYTEVLKKRIMYISYGLTNPLGEYEFDHLIPLELGGAPYSVKNLWPEAHSVLYKGRQEGSYKKDGIENSLRAAVCNGSLTLAAARKEMKKGTWLYLK